MRFYLAGLSESREGQWKWGLDWPQTTTSFSVHGYGGMTVINYDWMAVVCGKH